MQFKNPEILWFLFLLAIPIIVHLFQLRRFRKEYFTNVKFLKELSIQTRKSSKIKKWLLLASRLLLLACLIIAFAQPFFKAKDSKGSSNEMYIVLDNSFSMQAKGQQGELLKRAVENLLEHSPENRSFSLLTNSETYWNTDIKSIRRDLQNLKYSALAFNPESQLAKIRARKSPFDKDVIIITDGIGVQPNQLKSIKDNMNAWFILPEAEQRNNVSIDSVYLNQTLDNFYEISVRLSAFGDVEEIPVALYNNGKLIAKTQAEFDAKTKNINFTIPKEDFHGYASITDKGLAYDNTLFFSLSKPEKINVLSIGSADKSAFLSKIYTPAEFNYRNFEPGTLDYNLIERQDAVVINELKEIPQALQTTLKSFVEKGGNLVVVPAMDASLTEINSFLSNFGAVKLTNSQNVKKQITRISFGHPLYSGVFEKKIENFQYPETSASFTINSGGTAALAYEDQSAFLTAVQNQMSTVYVFAAPLNRDNSNFQNSPLIVPTFYNMAQQISKSGIVSMTIGESRPYFVDAGLEKDEILQVRNNDERFIPVQQAMSNRVRLTFNESPTQAGNFNIFRGNDEVGKISFNYNRTESELTEVDKNVFADYEIIDNIESVFDKLQQDRTQNEIWKWFVLLALFFLITEILIQKFVK